MKKFPKVSGKGPFFKLDGRHQTAIKAIVEDNLSDDEIGSKVGRTGRTIRNWKNDDLFIKAKEQYLRITIRNIYVPKAVNHLYFLMLHAKSEMVQMQSAITILKMAGMLSDNSTPELDKAKVRKAQADAEVAEQKAKAMHDNSDNSQVIIVDDIKEAVERENRDVSDKKKH